MDRIKEESKANGPKGVISKVSAELGGVTGATDGCSLPRNEQQVTKAKSRCKTSEVPSCSAASDKFAIVVHHAYLEDHIDHFIRDVKTLREPAVIVCLDCQLDEVLHRGR